MLQDSISDFIRQKQTFAFTSSALTLQTPFLSRDKYSSVKKTVAPTAIPLKKGSV